MEQTSLSMVSLRNLVIFFLSVVFVSSALRIILLMPSNSSIFFHNILTVTIAECSFFRKKTKLNKKN